MTEREKKQLLSRAEKLKPRPRLLPSGTWRCEAMVNGKRISVTGNTPEDAHAKAIALKTGLIEAEEKHKKITLQDAMERYIAAGEGVLSPSTLRGYDIIVRNRLKGIMDHNIYTLTRMDVKEAISQEAKQVSPKTVRNVYGFLTAVMNEYGLDFSGMKMPQKIKKEVKYLSVEEAVKLIDAAAGDLCETPIIMALWLGLRRSEILGLHWDCIDFEKKTISVRRTVVMSKENKMVEKMGAKNIGSQRTVKCPDYIMEQLKQQYHGQSGPVFDLASDTMRKHVHAICKKAGITDTTIHGLRHTNAAIMIALNVVDKYAMARNGWTSDYTFKQIYGYVFPEEADKVDEAVNAFFENAMKKQNLRTNLRTEK